MFYNLSYRVLRPDFYKNAPVVEPADTLDLGNVTLVKGKIYI